MNGQSPHLKDQQLADRCSTSLTNQVVQISPQCDPSSPQQCIAPIRRCTPETSIHTSDISDDENDYNPQPPMISDATNTMHNSRLSVNFYKTLVEKEVDSYIGMEVPILEEPVASESCLVDDKLEHSPRADEQRHSSVSDLPCDTLYALDMLSSVAVTQMASSSSVVDNVFEQQQSAALPTKKISILDIPWSMFMDQQDASPDVRESYNAPPPRRQLGRIDSDSVRYDSVNRQMSDESAANVFRSEDCMLLLLI